jgi:hypothetical protein
VEKRLVEEKAGGLGTNATDWVNFLSEELRLIQGTPCLRGAVRLLW